MKNRGLQNRFPQEVKFEWQYWHSCMICGENGWDALHHILSPTCRQYIKGDHNKSILNSCPIHNEKCHLYNPELHKKIPDLLVLVYQVLVQELHYQPKDIDIQFIKVYNKLYKESNVYKNLIKKCLS